MVQSKLIEFQKRYCPDQTNELNVIIQNIKNNYYALFSKQKLLSLMKHHLLIFILFTLASNAIAQKKTYDYDEVNRVKKAYYWNAGAVAYTITYDYDAVGNRLSKTVTPNGNPLPVTLISFDATNQNNQTVLLKWLVSEVSNESHFDIERSQDSRLFTSIGVKDISNTKEEVAYQHTDNKPYLGTNYYRLKMVDIDGKFTFSMIVSAKITDTNTNILYPNPSSTLLHITESESISNISILSADGKLIEKLNTAVDGINISKYPTGVYILQYQKNGKLEVSKFVKE